MRWTIEKKIDPGTEKRGVDMDTVFISRRGQNRIAPMLHSNLYRSFFGNRRISRRQGYPWPAHCADLPFLEYFLQWYLYDRVCANNPEAIDALKNNIRTELKRIPRDMLDTGITNCNVRV